MECKQVRSLLDPLIDGELSLERSLEIEAHIESCSACAVELKNLELLKAAVREKMPYYRASAELRERLHKTLSTSAAVHPAIAVTSRDKSRRPALLALPAFAVLVLLCMTLLHFPQSPSVTTDPVVDEVLSGHLRSLMGTHLADVISTDRHTVKPWFAGKLDFSPPVLDLKTEGFPLIAGRLDYLNAHPVAAVIYRHNKHIINLFIWPTTNAESNRVPRTFSRRGYNLIHWTDGSMTYWAVSDMNQGDLNLFADDFRREK